jgi:hypothetical protein
MPRLSFLPTFPNKTLQQNPSKMSEENSNSESTHKRGGTLGETTLQLSPAIAVRLRPLAKELDVSSEAIANNILHFFLGQAREREAGESVEAWVTAVLTSHRETLKTAVEAIEEARRVTALARSTIETIRTFVFETHAKTLLGEDGKRVKEIPTVVWDQLVKLQGKTTVEQ